MDAMSTPRSRSQGYSSRSEVSRGYTGGPLPQQTGPRPLDGQSSARGSPPPRGLGQFRGAGSTVPALSGVLTTEEPRARCVPAQAASDAEWQCTSGPPDRMEGWFPAHPRCEFCPLAKPGFGTLVDSVLVRESHEISSAEVDLLPEGTVVEVTEVRGRRGRIRTPYRGWLSLSSSTGQTLVAENAQLWLPPEEARRLETRLEHVASLEPPRHTVLTPGSTLEPPSLAAVWRSWVLLHELCGSSPSAELQRPDAAVDSAHGRGLLTRWEARYCGLSDRPLDFPGFRDAVLGDGGSRARGPCAWLVDVLESRRGLVQWPVPAPYNWGLSTEENYAGGPAQGDAGGAAAAPLGGLVRESRSALDPAHHGRAANYLDLRRTWQDLCVSSLSPRTPRRPHPVAVFTAGPPGAGKTYLCEFLASQQGQGLVRPHSFVRVSVDDLRQLLPEYPRYRSGAASSGEQWKPAEQTQQEASLLAELVLNAAVRERQCIWVDGTMCDFAYHKALFRRIRSQCPDYKIIALVVKASERTCRQRILLRARSEAEGGEGRAVPPGYADKCMKALEKVRDRLLGEADAVCCVDNDRDGRAPQVESWDQRDPQGKGPPAAASSPDWRTLALALTQ
eukprot:TRINITY_DN70195_c0_g1_i1.p1 TRINITY_DN70195_c0_g1~~TRINITY_DN70195_c0_g1_i1.p1  ORF type:complete len:646 (+),score=212.98 TRINITY_DN70195_c0_g1_i1:86-1939(+)